VNAWWAALRHEARRHGLRSLLLVAFVAIGGGVVLSAFIGARRDATAIERMTGRVGLATAALLPNDPAFDWAPYAALPGVRTLQRIAISYFDVVDHPDVYTDFPRVGPATGEPVEGVVLLAGRRADPSRADEVTIGDSMAASAHVAIGDELTLRIQPAAVVAALLAGQAPPDVAPIDVPVHVVGIVRGGVFAGGLQTTDAFYAQHAADLSPPGIGYVNALVRLEGGPEQLASFSEQVDRLAGRPIEVMDAGDLIRGARRAIQLETAAVLAFAVTAGLVVAVLGGIWISRTAGASAESLRVLRALGFTRRNAVTLAAALPAIATVFGALGAVVVATLLSGRYPIGLGRGIEPSPGRRANLAGLAIGSTVIVLLGVSASLLAARRVERRATSGGSVTAAGRWSVEQPLTASIGARLAVSGRTDGGSRAATAALTFGMLAVVGALTFGAGLQRAATDPSLSGQRFDSGTGTVGRGDPPTDLATAWKVDERVDWGARILDLVADLDGSPVSLFAVEDLKGSEGAVALRGRLPETAGEIALAPGELRRLDTDVGSDVHLPDGTPLRVVGEVFTPTVGHTGYDNGGRVTTAQLEEIEAAGTAVKFDSLVVRATRSLSDDELDQVWLGREHERAGLVEVQTDLGRTATLPRLLAWFAGALAALTAAAVLVVTTKRRRREVAVLQVLGLTRRQARRIVGWQVLTSVGVAVVVGVPAGFALGRTLWEAMVDGVPLRYVTPTAWGAIGVVVLGVAVFAGVLASRPIALTAAEEPGLCLRAE